ncbi:PspC domain-containing protein [Daejeonella sp. H1SJ63]|jgi:phage shock protein PspC (stress-responsive transcriptional regulator)|uniref:PspC domain-containing protein n=1 Tax=Daejeonella sp. H1SJ63 TaxID=3034145 RepID=UPI0023EA97EE|nr:PspC domain-containing protein [Daejeonella sp. H1SJ63]
MEKKLQRNEQDKMIAGVCSGLAEYFDVDVTWVRIAFVLAVMAGASGILAYIVLWIAVPKKPYIPDYGQFNADYKVYDQPNPGFTGQYSRPKKYDHGTGRLIAGSIFILFGAFFLLNEFNLIPDWVEFHTLWPLILIAMGVYTLSKSFRGEAVNQSQVNDEPKASATDENRAEEQADNDQSSK